MGSSQVCRVLVVASKTATSGLLMKAIDGRAAAGPCQFTLLIPDATDRENANRALEAALPAMTRAAGTPVNGLVGGPDPFEAVRDAVQDGDFDEIIVSTLPKRASRWLRRDLISRVEALGVPVTAVVPKVIRDPTAGIAAFRG
jgi:hypothetical protein